MKPIQAEYQNAMERIHGLPSRTHPSAVQLFAADEKQTVGLGSLELEAAPAQTITGSARRCRQLLADLDRKAAAQKDLTRRWEKKLKSVEYSAHQMRVDYEREQVAEAETSQAAAKKQYHAAVMRQFRATQGADQQFHDTVSECAKLREAKAMQNQDGLENMRDRAQDIAEEYNIGVKNWDRSVPRARPSPRSPAPPAAKAAKAAAKAKASPRQPDALQSRALDEALKGPAERGERVVAGSANSVSSRTLRTWLLSSDPEAKAEQYVPPGGRHDHKPRPIYKSVFPKDYVPSSQRHH